MAGATAFIFITQPPLAHEIAFLERLTQKVENLETPMREVTGLFTREFEANFASSGRPGWTPLSPSTKTKKARLGHDPRILRATGALESGAGSDWDVRGERGGARAEFPDPTGYGRFHVTGTSFMPSRDWAFVAEDALSEADRVFLEWPLVGE